MKIELNCASCGDNHFAIDRAMTDDCVVTCEDCNHEIGTLGQLKDRIAEEIAKRSSLSRPSS